MKSSKSHRPRGFRFWQPAKVRLTSSAGLASTQRALALVSVVLAIALVSCGGGDPAPERIATDPGTVSPSATTSGTTPVTPDDPGSPSSTVIPDNPAGPSSRVTPDDPAGLSSTVLPEEVPRDPDGPDISDGKTPAPAPAPTPAPTLGPADTPTPEPPLVAGYDLELSEGDFWRFRWEYTDHSCAQGSGCKTKKDDGVFQVTLGEPKQWKGATVYRLVSVGETGYHDSTTNRTFVPEWDYLGVDGHRLVATNASGRSPLVTLFDAQTGVWAGSGFFAGRFPDDVLVGASPGSLTGSHEFASWDGVQTGPWHYVSAADSGGECSLFDGRILCPSEEKFDYTETEYYRPGIGPFGYMFNYSMSFSGGGFSSSFQTGERVALVASSFMGDETGDFGKPTPVPPTATPTPAPTPVVLGDPIFGPVDGRLRLDPRGSQIPEFNSGVDIDAGVIDVTFENPDVAGKWSHGIFIRNSAEETFHAVFINSDGEWGHFARGGSLASQVTIALGQFDFDTASGGTNKLTVWFGVLGSKTTGYFQINDEDVAVLDLSFTGALSSGDVTVVSGLFPSDDFNGSMTYFTNFTVFEKP